ncbi:hypothetical protein QTI66_20990 [Variovorax sp. J22R133]|uniref:hypothetical protein n=1 Tax=Variovorax brevis TaxID=3053503 RepID=UPI0025768DC3|nr:hypothetical protein [Variovorax sp. J22R133]MDM0114641.1 hypothetical protein [Variovorax sp. J22R133]
MLNKHLKEVAAANAAGTASVALPQTPWPDYMPTLNVGLSGSPIAAVLPTDIWVTPPAAEVPRDKARWSGIWNGWARFARQCDVKIAVEHVTPHGAAIAYASASAAKVIRERAVGEFVGDELHVRLQTGGVKLILRLRNAGVMEISLWKPDTELVSAGVLSPASPDPALRDAP